MDKDTIDPRTHTKPHEKELTHFRSVGGAEVSGLSGPSFVHGSYRLGTNAFFVLFGRSGRADGFPGKAVDPGAGLEDNLPTRTPFHLWAVDAAEEQPHNEVYRAITDRVITELVYHLQVPLRTI